MAVAPSPARQFCKLFHLRHAGRNERRLENEVLRRITGHEQLREHQQVRSRPCRGLMRLARKPSVRGECANRRIELGKHDFEFVDHGALLDFCA
jgi:hypothetical protein